MSRERSDINIPYIRTQAIAYFVFAVIFTRALAIDVGSTRPLLSFYKSGPIPLPYINFPPWVTLSLAFFCLAVSFFFVATLFWPSSLMNAGVRVANWLSVPFYPAVLVSFFATWSSSLNPILGISQRLFEVFFWAGYILLLAKLLASDITIFLWLFKNLSTSFICLRFYLPV